MLKKFKILSAPISFVAVFLTITAGAVLYFHFAQAFSTFVDLGLTSASFTLDSNNPQLVHYKATVKNTGQKASDQYYYAYEKELGRKVSFSVLNSDPKIEICVATIPVIQPNGGASSVECTSNYVPSNNYGQVEAKITATAGDPYTDNVATYPMYPILESTFTQVPPYYNLNDKLNPAQTFVVNVKNTGFPLKNNIVDGFSFFHRGSYSCKTTVLFDQVNSPTGQNVSCAITPTITSSQTSYDVIFSSSNPYVAISQTVKTGAPDLIVSEIYCGERLNSGSSITCSISIKNNSLPIAQNSLTRGLVVKASFFDSTRKTIGTSNKEVCSFDFSNADILTLNTSGGILIKQCAIPSTNIPAGTMFVNTTATIDPQNIIKETSEGNNTSLAKEVSFQGQDATQVVNIIVKIDPSSVSVAGIKILFQDADGFLQATCFGSACSVNLPSGEYQALTNSTFIDCSAPDCPLKFQVADRAVNLELKVKSTAPPTTNFCSDSDANEANPYLTQGAVRFYSKNSQVFSGMTDSCVGGKIREYSCSTGTYNFIDFSCPNGCYKGACVQKCATLFGSADLQCKSLGEMEIFKQQCSNKEVVYDKLRVGQYCSNTGGNYCVQCKPECENDVDCNTRQCPIAGEESYCSTQKCACRKSLPDLTVTTALTCPKSLYSISEPILGCSITIKNVGTASTLIAPKTNLYDVTGSTWKQLSQIPYPGVLAQNASTVIKFGDFSFDKAGIYKLQACVDYKTNEVTERNEDNNCSDILPIEAKASPVASLPDLTAGVLTCPKNLYNTGDSISGCSITIKNQGAAVAGTATNRPTTILRYRTAKSAWTTLDTKTLASALAITGTEKIIFKDLNFDTEGAYILQSCVDPDSKIAEGNTDLNINAENNNCSAELPVEVKELPLAVCSPAGWWCGTYSDWKGQCSGSGTYQILADKNICKKTGENYCVTCGVTTVFDTVSIDKKPVANIQLLLSPVDPSSNFGRIASQTSCVTNGQGSCSVVLIPGVKYSVTASSEQYKCSDCANSTFTAKLDDYIHTLTFEETITKCSTIKDCSGIACIATKTLQCFDGQCVCKDVVAPSEVIDCQKEYGAGWWCGTYSDWKGQCYGSGNFKELVKSVCDEKGNGFCNTCGVKTLFNAIFGANKQPIAGVQILLGGSSVANISCLTDARGACSVVLIPGVKYSVTASSKQYKCSDCANSTFTAQVEDYIHTLIFDKTTIKCSANSGCSNLSCLKDQTPQCINAMCVCKDVVISPTTIDCQKEYGKEYECNTYGYWKEFCGNGGGKFVDLLDGTVCDDSATGVGADRKGCVSCPAPLVTTKCSSAKECVNFPCLDKLVPQCSDGICKCANVAPPQWIDCKVKYNSAYWCSSYVDWTKECTDKADPNAIKQEILCNGNNGDYCVTCSSNVKPPTVCSDCGKGIFNACDIKECQNLGKDCVFLDGKCFPQNTKEIIIPLQGDKETKMTIPAGTFLVSVTPTVSAISPNSVDASGLSSLGTPLKFVDFSIKYDDDRKATFDGYTIPIQVSYADQKINKTDEDSLRLYIFNGTIWEPLDTTINKDTKTLTAQASHFSVIVVAKALYSAGNSSCLPCCVATDCDTAGYTCDGAETTGANKCVGPTTSGDDFTFSGGYGECQLIAKPVVCSLTKFDNPDDLINNVSGWIFKLALIIAPLMILLGGFYMLTAAGEPARSTQGKTIITWALVGLAVILAAKAFISIITSVLK
ncbi:MAG: CARDB domain-containing protein [bacterium]|nr:CARDB domain-containing protein [bacterium]